MHAPTRRRLLAALIALCALAGHGPAGAGPATRSDEMYREAENRRFVAAAFADWHDGKRSIFELLADDARWTIVGTSKVAGTYEGREAFLAQVIRPFGARVAQPLKPTIEGLYADGDTVVVLFEGRAVANDGREYVNTYSWYLTIDDGRIVRAVAFFDPVTFDDLWRRVAPRPSPAPPRPS